MEIFGGMALILVNCDKFCQNVPNFVKTNFDELECYGSG